MTKTRTRPDLRRLTSEQARAIRLRLAEGETYRTIAEEVGMSVVSVFKIHAGLTYKDGEAQP